MKFVGAEKQFEPGPFCLEPGPFCLVKNKHTDIAKFLAEEGALVNARNGDGKSPIDLANDSGQAELAVFFQQFSVA